MAALIKFIRERLKVWFKLSIADSGCFVSRLECIHVSVIWNSRRVVIPLLVELNFRSTSPGSVLWISRGGISLRTSENK